MDLLLEGKRIDVVASNIVYNTVKNRWDIYGEDNVFLYAIKGDYYVLVENVELPEDYEDGKYYFDNDSFILVSDWKPYVSPEERITILEEENEKLKTTLEAQAEVLDFLLML